MIFLLTFALLFLSFVGLSIGYLITGKSKLHKKCGYRPSNDKKADCKNGGCELCSKESQNKNIEKQQK